MITSTKALAQGTPARADNPENDAQRALGDLFPHLKLAALRAAHEAAPATMMPPAPARAGTPPMIVLP